MIRFQRVRPSSLYRFSICHVNSLGWCNLIFAALVWSFLVPMAFAQPKGKEKPKQEAGGAQGASVEAKPSEDAPGSEIEAINIYADAANFQNNRAYDLAIVEWKKLIEKFPKDPLIAKAQHYLGVSYMQLETPDYGSAIDAFKQSLKDEASEVRQESLVDLGWCQYAKARQLDQGATEQLELFKNARDTMLALLKSHAETEFADQALFYAGEADYALGNRDSAVTYYSKLLSTKSLAASPLRQDALYAIGVSYEELKKSEDAIKSYTQLLKEFPAFRLAEEVKIRKADLHIQLKQLPEAEELYAEAAARTDNPNADYAQYRLAYCLAQQNRLDDAAEAYQQLVAKFPSSQYVLLSNLAAGQALFRQGKLDDAAAAFKQVLSAKNAQAAEAAHWLSQIAFRSKNVTEAEQYARDGLSWADDSPIKSILQLDLADVLYEQPGKQAESRKIYEDLVNADPKGPLAGRAAYNVAFAALQAGELEKASQWAKRFLKDYSDDPLKPDVQYVAAESLLQLGQHEAALDAYTELLKEEKDNPSRPLWILRLNTAKYLAGQYDKVIAALGPQVDRFSDASQQAEALYLVGASQYFLKQYPQAIESFEASRTREKKWSQADEVLLLLSQSLNQVGKADQAKSTLQELLSDYPNSRFLAQAHYRLGQLEAASSNYESAINSYDQVIELKPKDSVLAFAQYGKAWSLLQLQKFDESLTLLDDLLVNCKDETILGEATLARGICLRQSGKLDQSIDALAKFVDSKPTGDRLGHGLFELGLGYSQSKQYELAANTFLKLKQEVPNYSALDKALYELGWSQKQQKKEPAAVVAFAELFEKYPDSPLAAESAYHVAQSEYANSRFDRASELYAEAVKRAKDADLKEKSQYKLGWSIFQQGNYDKSSKLFKEQVDEFPNGKLVIDGVFMQAECLFKQEKYSDASSIYKSARELLEKREDRKDIAPQVQALIYLHGAQCLREVKEWKEEQQWLQVILDRYADSPYVPQTLYELAYSYQNQDKLEDALRVYSDVAGKYRNDIAARARFMMGEVHFSQRDFAKAIPEFQRVMYGFGGEKAPEEIKNWQARSGFEAGRCSEVLIADLTGDRRAKAIKIAKDFYEYVVAKHPKHEFAAQAKKRLDELTTLR